MSRTCSRIGTGTSTPYLAAFAVATVTIFVVPPRGATILLLTKVRPCLRSIDQVILPSFEAPPLSPIIVPVPTTTTSSSSKHELSGRSARSIHLHPSHLPIVGGTSIPWRGEAVTLPQLAGGLIDARQTQSDLFPPATGSVAVAFQYHGVNLLVHPQDRGHVVHSTLFAGLNFGYVDQTLPSPPSRQWGKGGQ